MKLLLRSRRLQGRLEHPVNEVDDFVVLDDGVKVGCIRGEMRHVTHQYGWRWSIEIFPAPHPREGFEVTLEEAKAAFKKRYAEMLAENEASMKTDDGDQQAS